MAYDIGNNRIVKISYESGVSTPALEDVTESLRYLFEKDWDSSSLEFVDITKFEDTEEGFLEALTANEAMSCYEDFEMKVETDKAGNKAMYFNGNIVARFVIDDEAYTKITEDASIPLEIKELGVDVLDEYDSLIQNIEIV